MKKENGITCMAKYIACGMIVGSALGTGTAVLLKTKQNKKNSCTGSCNKNKSNIREKITDVMDTVGTIMTNVADLTR